MPRTTMFGTGLGLAGLAGSIYLGIYYPNFAPLTGFISLLGGGVAGRDRLRVVLQRAVSFLLPRAAEPVGLAVTSAALDVLSPTVSNDNQDESPVNLIVHEAPNSNDATKQIAEAAVEMGAAMVTHMITHHYKYTVEKTTEETFTDSSHGTPVDNHRTIEEGKNSHKP